MKIYAIYICTFSCDIMEEGHIDSYWSTRDKAETNILERGLLDLGFQDVYIKEYNLDRGPTL